MKTVKDYLDLGLVFVDSDKLLSVSNDKDSKEVCMSWLCIAHERYCDGLRGGNAIFFYPSEWAPSSFAWRNNDGVKPEYKGVIEFVLNGGQKCTDYVSEITWIRGLSYSVAKWRPVVLQSESPTVSPKEDKPMKPVYTAEMHAKGELPPVGAECDICYENNGLFFKGSVIAYFEDLLWLDLGGKNPVRMAREVKFKPIIKTIKVNGFDVPMPMSAEPKFDYRYFAVDLLRDDLFSRYTWKNGSVDHTWLAKGIMHSTESAAIAHAKAMLGIDPNA